MTTPAKASYERRMAEIESKSETHRGDLSLYENMLAQLYEHKRSLKNIQSFQSKAELKAKLLPEYEAYLSGVLAADAGHDDEVVTTLLVWAIDAREFEQAFKLAAYVLKHNLSLPDQYQRTAGCLIAEELSAIDDINAETLDQFYSLVINEDMPDQVRAKIEKAMGMALEKTDPKQALLHLKEALARNPRSGVKKLIASIEKQLNSASPEA